MEKHHMDRQEFLLTIWKKLIKPVLLVAVLWCFISFLYTMFVEFRFAKLLVTLIVGLGLLFTLAYFVSHIFEPFLKRIYLSLPKPVKTFLKLLTDLLNFVAPVIFGAIIYHFWYKDWKSSAVILSVFLVSRIIEQNKNKRTEQN